MTSSIKAVKRSMSRRRESSTSVAADILASLSFWSFLLDADSCSISSSSGLTEASRLCCMHKQVKSCDGWKEDTITDGRRIRRPESQEAQYKATRATSL